MAFVNFSLIFGGLLLAIPIVLHLLMRQQPKQLVFPALRFLKARRDANRRQLQLRHWLLLLLRCLAIVLFAAALARPSVPSLALGNWIIIGVLGSVVLGSSLLAAAALLQRRGRLVAGGAAAVAVVSAVVLMVMLGVTIGSTEPSRLGHREAPVGAVLLFDSSPRMQYVWQNKSRLEQARETALWLIQQLPADSELAVLDARPGPAAFAVDLAAAQRAVERLDVTFVPAPLVRVLDQAIELAATSTQSRKEVYVLTDLTRSAWQAESSAALRRRLAEVWDVAVHIIDVGCERPQNLALGDLQLSAQLLPKSGELQIRTQVDGVGTGGARTAELFLESPDPERPYLQNGQLVQPTARLRRQEVVTIPADGAQAIEFRVANLELGVQQGFIKLSGQDGLACDDVRYFTVDIQEALPVLVLAPAGTTTRYLTEAIAPYEFRETGRARYECTVREQAELPNADLSEYAAVCLLDPAPLTPSEWEKLSTYVRSGGGLAVFLGHRADTSSFNVPAAAPLIGGKLTRQWRSEGDVFLSPRDFHHPVTSAFRDMASGVPWTRFPVYRHWVLDDVSPQTRLVLPLSNNKPAILETPWGQGRTLLMTTPISDPLRPRGRPAWNELPSGENAWPFVVLVNEMVRYLVDTASLKLNYQVGETAVLANRRDRDPDRYQLFTPLEQPQEVTAAAGKVVVKFTEYPGAYRLKGQRGGPVVRGFCANLPRAASDLTRMTRAELDEALGAGRYHYARNTDEIQLGVGESRMGREFYPLLLALLAIALGLEQLLANRFYRSSE